MTEPINPADLGRVDFSGGAAKNDFSSTNRYYSGSTSDLTMPRTAVSAKTISAREYALAVEARFNDIGSNVRVGVDTVNGNTVFTIRDGETGQIIRKIPSDEAIRIATNIDNLSGLYVDRLE